MIRYFQYSAETTAELAKRIAAAGEGAVLRVIPKGTDDGAMKLYLAVRHPNDFAKTDDECDPPLNEASACPPICG